MRWGKDEGSCMFPSLSPRDKPAQVSRAAGRRDFSAGARMAPNARSARAARFLPPRARHEGRSWPVALSLASRLLPKPVRFLKLQALSYAHLPLARGDRQGASCLGSCSAQMLRLASCGRLADRQQQLFGDRRGEGSGRAHCSAESAGPLSPEGRVLSGFYWDTERPRS